MKRLPNLESIPGEGKPAMQLYINKKNVAPLPSRRRYPLARRHARELECLRQEGTQRLVGRVQDIIVGLGLTQAGNSVAGGRTTIIPEVISVTERPVGFDIRMLPGQIPDDFATHAKRIAYNLGVAEVRVIPLGPSLIRLILVPETSRSDGWNDSA